MRATRALRTILTVMTASVEVTVEGQHHPGRAQTWPNREIPLAPVGAAFAGTFSYGLYDPMGRVLYLRYLQDF